MHSTYPPSRSIATRSLSSRHDGRSGAGTARRRLLRLLCAAAALALPLPALAAPGITFHPKSTSIRLTEGQTYTVQVYLTETNSSQIAVHPLPSDVFAVTAEPLSAYWYPYDAPATSRTFTITAEQDADKNDETVSIEFKDLYDRGAVVSRTIQVAITDDDVPSLRITPANVSVTEGSTATVAVGLSVAPTAAVTVSVANDNAAALSLSASSLTFAKGSTAAQNVTLTTGHDGDTADATATLSWSASGGNYSGVTQSTKVTVSDDDSTVSDLPGFRFSPLSLSLTEGGTAVTLTATPVNQPAKPVQIIPVKHPLLTITPATQLTFPVASGRAAQSFTVAAKEDNDLADLNTAVTLQVTNVPPGTVHYHRVPVRISDDDTGAIQVTPAARTVWETGSAAFDVALTHRPPGAVRVTVSSGDTSALVVDTDTGTAGNQNTLSFTADNWSTAQRFFVFGLADDDTANETVTVTLAAAGAGYDTITKTASVTVNDDDTSTHALDLSTAGLDLDEGGSGTFTVQLRSSTTAPATVTVTSRDTGAATVNPTTLSFTSDTWYSPQTVTVTAVQDADGSDESVPVHLRLAGANISVTGSVLVDVDDDELIGLTLAPTKLYLDEGGTGTFTVKPKSQPSQDLTISLATVAPGVATADTDTTTPGNQATLTFTPSNWQTAQTVTVTALRDPNTVQDTTAFLLTADDSRYPDMTATAWAFVADVDSPALRLSRQAMTVGEGATRPVTVRLATKPAADVTVGVASDDDAVAVDTDAATAGKQTTLVFTPANWNRAKTMFVSGVEDADTTTESATLTLSATGADYGTTSATITVWTVDDDAAATKLLLSPLDDTGISNLDAITSRTSRLTIRGELPADVTGSRIQLYDAGVAIAGATTRWFLGPDSRSWRIDIALTAGTHSITAKLLDANDKSVWASDPLALTVDTTAPSVSAVGYFRDAAATQTLSGSVTSGTAIYTKVTFSEKMAHTAASGATARPDISWRINSNSTRYRIVSGASVLASGQCKPTATADTYVCKFVPTVGQSGSFDVQVGTGSADYAGNTLAAAHTPAVALTLDDSRTIACGVATSGTPRIQSFFPAHGARIDPAAMSDDTSTASLREDRGPSVLFSAAVWDGQGNAFAQDQTVIDRVFTLRAGSQDIDFHGRMRDGRGMTLRRNASGDSIWSQLPEGAVTVSVSNGYRDAQQGGTQGTAACATFTVDKTAPTVDDPNSGYYSDAGATLALDGAVGVGGDIYAKVAFKEAMQYQAGTGSAARPAIAYRVAGGAATAFDMVAATATLATGQCRPAAAGAAQAFVCRYTVQSGDQTSFDFQVGTATRDLAGHALASTYTHASTATVETTAPTVQAAAFYQDAAATNAVTGAVLRGADIYTKVTFSEDMTYNAADHAGARPAIRYAVGAATTRYHMVAASATLASGDCQPLGAQVRNQYLCRYTVGASDQGTFGLSIAAHSTDQPGNPLAADYTHATSLTLDTPPAFSGAIADQTWEQNGVITALTLPNASGGNGQLVHTLTPTLPAGLSLTESNGVWTVSGRPTTAAAATQYAWTAADADGNTTAADQAALTFAITIPADATGPRVKPDASGYYTDDTLATALTGSRRRAGEIYTKVTFSEAVTFTPATDASARPHLSYRIGKQSTQYRIVARAAALASGECKPVHAGRTDVYVCRYTVTATDDGSFALQASPKTTDTAGLALVAYTHAASLTVDGVNPTVQELQTDYFSDAALTTSLARQTVSSGAIYTKVVFSEDMTYTAGSTAAARPHIAYSIARTPQQYRIVARTATLASGDCKPSHATRTDTWVCRYDVAFGSGSGKFGVQVSAAADVVGNALAATYAHGPKVTIDHTSTAVCGTVKSTGPNVSEFHPAHGSFVNPTTIRDGNSNSVLEDRGPAVTFANQPWVGSGGGGFDTHAQMSKLLTLRLGGANGTPVTSYVLRSLTGFTFQKSPTASDRSSAVSLWPDLPEGRVYIGVSNQYWVGQSDFGQGGTQGAAACAIFVIDRTAPQVDGDDSGYSGDAAGADALTGTVAGATDIYTTVAFTEPVVHVEATDSTARPAISYRIAGTATRYAIVDHGDTLASGQCQPTTATLTETFLCRYTVAAGDAGSFDFQVGTDTADRAANALAKAYTHGTALTLESAAPTVDADDSGYFGAYANDGTLSSALTGTIAKGVDIYTRVTFSEDVKHTAGDGAAARPAISYTIGTASTRYHVVAASAALASGDCKPNHATETDEYVCRYTVTDSDDGAFGATVGTQTTDTAGNALADAYTHAATLTLNASPTVVAADSGYYDDAALTTTLSGAVDADDDVHTRVSFSEEVKHTAGDGAAARPAISYTIGTAATRYHIVAASAALASGDCKPNHATETDEYVCLYTRAAADVGLFAFQVGTTTTDKADVALSAAYTHAASLTFGDVAPTFASGASIADQVWEQNAAITDVTLPTASGGNGTLSYSITPALPAGVTLDTSGAAPKLTGTPSATAAQAQYTFTVADGDANTAAADTDTLTFKITVGADATAPTVVADESGYYTSADLTTTLTGPLKKDDDIYLKIRFSEDVAHTVGNKQNGAPPLFYRILEPGQTGRTRFDILAPDATLARGDCKPNHATRTHEYLCRYKVGGGDNGQFDFRVDAKLTDAQGVKLSAVYTHATKLTVDTTAPTLTAASSGYFGDAALTAPLTGTVRPDTDIYTKVTFSEDVIHTVADDDAARPVISYRIGAKSRQYDVLADHAATLADGDCKPAAAATGASVWVCRYAVGDSEDGAFGFHVASDTADAAGNQVTFVIHATTLTLNSDRLPAFAAGAAVADQVWERNTAVDLTLPTASGGDGTLSYGIAPTLPAGLSLTTGGAAPKITGTPTAAKAAATYTFTVTDADKSDPDSDTLTFSITVNADRTGPSVLAASSGYFSDAALTKAVTRAANGADVYTRVTFADEVTVVTGDGAAARPAIRYRIAGAPTAYRIVGASSALADGACKPNHASETDEFVCRYVVALAADASFDFQVGSATEDLHGNAMASAYTHGAALALDASAPTFGSATLRDRKFIIGAPYRITLPAATGGAGPLTYTLQPAPHAGLTFDAATRLLAGTPAASAIIAGVQQPRVRYTYTATDANGASTSLQYRAQAEVDIALSIAHAAGDQVLTVGREVLAGGRDKSVRLVTAATGNQPIAITLSPAPPPGTWVSQSYRTLHLQGTPTRAMPEQTYTVSVVDANGDRVAHALKMRVDADTVPSFGNSTIPDQRWTQFAAITPVSLPLPAAGNEPLSYSLSPTLPAGVRWDVRNSQLVGAPTGAHAATTYTYTARDVDGDTASLTFIARAAADPDTAGVSRVAFTTTGPYAAGDTVRVAVTFSGTVYVNATDGTPAIELDVGNRTLDAAYTSGHESKTLVFAYTVPASGADTAGLAIAADALKTNGGRITGRWSEAASLLHPAVPASAAQAIDTTAPSVSFSPGHGTVVDADQPWTITFSEAAYSDAKRTAFSPKALAKLVSVKVGTTTLRSDHFRTTISGDLVVTVRPRVASAGSTVTVSVSNDYYDRFGQRGAAAAAAFRVTKEARGPTVTFAPADATVLAAPDADLRLTFSEPVYANAAATTTFSADAIAKLITLHAVRKGGAAIPFAASIDGSNSVVTVNPTHPLPHGPVYLELADGWFDADGLSGTARSAVFTVRKITASWPTVSKPFVTAQFNSLIDVALPQVIANGPQRYRVSAPDFLTLDNSHNADCDVNNAGYLCPDGVRLTGAIAGRGADAVKRVVRLYAAPEPIAGVTTAAAAPELQLEVLLTSDQTDLRVTGVAFSTVGPYHAGKARVEAVMSFNQAIADIAAADRASLRGLVDLTIGSRVEPMRLHATWRGPGRNTLRWYADLGAAAGHDTDGIDIAAVDQTSNLITDYSGDAARVRFAKVVGGATQAADFTPPSITSFNASNAFASDAAVVITFSEPIYSDTSGTRFTTAKLAELVSVLDVNAEGIAIDAQIDAANRVVTVRRAAAGADKRERFWDAGGMSVTVGSGYWDAVDEQGATRSADYTVVSAAPSLAAAADQAWTQNVPITAVTLPGATGGHGAMTYRLTPALPTGVSFDPVTRRISGAPRTAQAATTYTYTVTDAAKASASQTFDVSVAKDTGAPTLTALTFAGAGPYRNGDTVEVTGAFSEPVTVATGGGTPLLTLRIGTAARFARYVSGSGTAALTFRYQVQGADADADGITIPANALGANGGAISDGVHAAVLTHAAVAADMRRRVDNTGPTVKLVTPGAGATVAADAVFTVTFDEPIFADAKGTPFNGQTLAQLVGLFYTHFTDTKTRAMCSATRFIDASQQVVKVDGGGQLCPYDSQQVHYTNMYAESQSVFDQRVVVTDLYYDAAGNAGTPFTSSFTVTDETPQIAAKIPDYNFVVNQPIKPITLPAAKGGNGWIEWFVQDQNGRRSGDAAFSLPAGLRISPSTRTISGTPTQPFATAAYTYNLREDGIGGSQYASEGFNMSVSEDSTPSFAGASFANQRFVKDAAIAAQTLPAVTGGNVPVTYAVTPALPTGVTFDAATRQLSGTPSRAQAAGTYNLVATDYDADSASLAFNIAVADDTAPTVTIAPANGARVADASTNIVLTFSEAVFSDAAGTTKFDSSALDDLISLRQESSTGTVISFSASIAASGADANRVVTIDPSADLPDGRVYVGVQRGYYDRSGNAGAAAAVLFTVDSTAPTGAFAGNAKRVTLRFSEAVYRDPKNTLFTTETLDEVLTLKADDEDGDDISFKAMSSPGHTVVTLDPASDFQDGDIVFAAISSGYYDSVGNQGIAASAMLSVDVNAPTITPGTLDLAAADDSGAADNDDITRNTTALTISGTLSGAAASDEFVQLYRGGTAIANATDASFTGTNSRDWSIDIALAAGTHTITAKVVDGQANAGPASAGLAITVDTTAPTVTGASSGYYGSYSGGTLSDALSGTVGGGTDVYTKVVFSEDVTQVAENDDKARPPVSYQIGDADAEQYDVVSASTGLASGDCRPNHTSERDEYVCRYTVAAGDSGTFDFQVSTGLQDVAGNALASAYTHGTTLTLDTSAPTITTGTPDLAAADDTGLADDDDLTKNTTGLTITGTLSGAAATGDYVQLYRGGAAISGAKDASFDGADSRDWSIDVSLAEGAHTITAKVLDSVANAGTASAALTITVDATAPAAPSFSPADKATTASAGTDVTITFAETVYGSSGEYDASTLGSELVTLAKTDKDGDAITFAASIDADNEVVTVDPGSDLSDGAVYAAVSGYRDAAGNVGSDASATFTVDTTAPTITPGTPDLAAADDTGSSNSDDITKNTTG